VPCTTVAFDPAQVTSTDWLSYPILDITEAPEAVDIVLINRPEFPPAGAGESSIRPVAAAIANAVFDASGVRLRRVPLTPERLKPALASAEQRDREFADSPLEQAGFELPVPPA
jgi:CO/xanthine dehydrogenase Mo-binding subunit